MTHISVSISTTPDSAHILVKSLHHRYHILCHPPDLIPAGQHRHNLTLSVQHHQAIEAGSQTHRTEVNVRLDSRTTDP